MDVRVSADKSRLTPTSLEKLEISFFQILNTATRTPIHIKLVYSKDVNSYNFKLRKITFKSNNEVQHVLKQTINAIEKMIPTTTSRPMLI